MPIRCARLNLKFVLCATVAALLLGAVPALAAAETFVVNTTADGSGTPGQKPCTGGTEECTLREAIGEANATADADTISFAGLPVGSVLRVEEAELPPITEGVTIDGATAAGATAGGPAIELEPFGFDGTPNKAIEVDHGDGTRIEGLAIGGFAAALRIGTEEAGNPTNTFICGNYLGLALDGVTRRENFDGVEVEPGVEGATIGDGAGCAGNVISGNASFGISDAGTGTRIGANVIGLDVEGGPMPNGTSDGLAAGIFEDGNARGTSIAGNVIAANRGSGVEAELGSSGVEIRQNSIFENEALGITVLSGPPPVPTVSSVTSPAPGVTLVKGTIEGVEAGETAELDFYANERTCAVGGVQGQTYLGTGTVGGGAVGAAEYSAELPVEVPAGETGITATATHAAGTTVHATSEFSNCATYTAPPTPPATAITTAPPISTTASAATFEFAAADGGATGFECSLDSATFTPCTSPQSFSGLAPGPHSFAVRSVGEGGRTGAASVYGWTVAGLPPPPQEGPPPTQSGPPAQAAIVPPPGPKPINGEKVIVVPVAGKVRVRLPGTNRYVSIKTLTEIPVGAVIDATKGKVTLTSIGPNGEVQTADFFGGVFRVKQKEGTGLVILELLDTEVCPAPPRKGKGGAMGGAEGSSIFARPTTSGTKGKLWGSGHGSFRTEGDDGSATVRGTIWLVEDRCDGTTFFRTRRGVVTVRDFILHKTLPLPAGKTYLAGEG